MSEIQSVKELSGPRGLPLLGNLHQAWRFDRAHLVVEKWCEHYGPLFAFRIGSRVVVVVTDVQEINRILRERPDRFRRWREVQAGFEGIGFPGLFSAEGEVWRRQRRLVLRALSSERLHRQYEIVRIATERLYRRLVRSAREGAPVQITRDLSCFTVDVASALVFGEDLNTLERGESELHGHIEMTFKMLTRRTLVPFPYWHYFKLPADRALDRSVRELEEAVEGFIERARVRLRERPELLDEPENLLEAMLAAQQREGGFTDPEIVGNVFTLLVAGEDTTAHTIAWTLWLLCRDAEVQDRWAAEAEEVLGERNVPAESRLLADLRYGEAVLRESMRLKSVSNTTAVETLVDTTVANVAIPAGTRLLLATRYASRASGGPKFNPGRWLAEDSSSPDTQSFLAFGAGPRFCPGRNLAFMEAKAALAMIARNFTLELDPSAGPVTERFSFTTIPNGLSVRLHERAGHEIPSGDRRP